MRLLSEEFPRYILTVQLCPVDQPISLRSPISKIAVRCIELYELLMVHIKKYGKGTVHDQ